MPDAQREHVIRRSSLPWRPPEDHLTECGRLARDHAAITYDEFTRKLRTQGQQRAAMSTCMTCWNTANRYESWAVDPVDAIRREILGQRGDTDTFRRELRALAALVEAHPDEFTGYLDGLQQTADLAARRLAKRQTGH